MESINSPETGSLSVFSKIKKIFLNNDHQKEKTQPETVTEILKQEQLSPKEYSKDEIKEIFKEEHLVSLSLEEYIDLLRQFPGEMVTHVTRQGIRDHIGMVYHNAGEGEYSDGFMKMVNDGRLRPTLGVCFTQESQENAVSKILRLDKDKNKIKTKKDALLVLDEFTKNNSGIPGGYSDRIAIHFAAEEVADCFYGSETGNEIFIAYPSIFIASQFNFTGELDNPEGGSHNNKWVWANGKEGLSLNSGIIFIPEEVTVNPITGSKYELDENNKLIINEANVRIYTDFVNSDGYFDFINQLSGIGRSYISGSKIENSSNVSERLMEEAYQPYRYKLEKEFGISDCLIQNAIFDYRNIGEVRKKKTFLDDLNNKYGDLIDSELIKKLNFSLKMEIQRSLKNIGCLYVEAQNPISSKEFWESYFDKNPDKKPSKIVYYKGYDPTESLIEWRKDQRINKKSDTPFMGFDENRIGNTSSEANQGVDEFKLIAEKVINDRFS